MVARYHSAAVLVSLALAATQPLAADSHLEKHVPPPSADGALFGTSAATDGGWAVVGAPSAAGTAPNSGAVFVFAFADPAWVPAAVLTAPDGAAGDLFGRAVALSGGWLAVGAPEDDAPTRNSGSVRLYQLVEGTWHFHSALTAGDAQTTDLFGSSVAVEGEWLLVGAPNEDDAGSNAGAVYAFRYDAAADLWHQEQKLAPGRAGDQFGSSLAIRNGTAAIGATGDDGRASNAGAVYIFEFDGAAWMQAAVLRGSDSELNDEFGAAVAVGMDEVLVGAPRDNIGLHTDAGSAYLFRRSGGWNQEAKLVSPDASASDFLGRSVAIDGDVALVGAPAEDAAGTNAGAAYIFRPAGGQWSADPRVAAPDAVAFDAFGSAIALRGDRVFIGATGVDDSGDSAGAAYSTSFSPENLPPQCDAGMAYEAECAGDSTRVQLDGSASSDPENDRLDFQWSSDCPNARFDDATSPNPVLTLSGGGCSLECRVTLSVSDGINPPVSCEAIIRVTDRSPPELRCPADANIIDGEDASPDSLGRPTASDCSPDVQIGFSDETESAGCASDSIASTTRRTWTATDACGNSASCTQLIRRMRIALALDIKPDDCANSHNAGSRGYLPALLLGADGLDLSGVDLASLRISRANCAGSALAPNFGPPGPSPVLGDDGTPASDEPCACHSGTPDGLADIAMHFDSEALAAALQLDGAGNTVTVVVSGVIRTADSPDGVSFIALDCLNLVGGGRGSGGGERGSGGGRSGGRGGEEASPGLPSVDPCGSGMLPGAMMAAALLLVPKGRPRGVRRR